MRHSDDIIFNLISNIYILNNIFFFFTLSPSCLSSALLPSSFIIIYLFAPEENFLSKPLVFPCFLLFYHIGEYISLDLFYSTDNSDNNNNNNEAYAFCDMLIPTEMIQFKGQYVEGAGL